MILRRVLCFALVGVTACVVKLSDRNEPEVNGAVTGAPANCGATQILPGGAPGGDPTPKFVGRFAFPTDPAAPQDVLFDWSGNSIRTRVQGTDHVTAHLSLVGDIPQDQLFEFVVDGQATVRQITVTTDAAGQPTTTPLQDYDIGPLDPGVPHEIILWKNTEAQKGSVVFRGFDLHGGQMLPPVQRARRIEFIGDSIMCGYGDEGQNATCPFEVKVRDVKTPDGQQVILPNGQPAFVSVPLTENNYLSFTSATARALDADAVTVCWSGKGVYKNYKERYVVVNGQTQLEPDTTTTVPQLWADRTIGNDFQGFKWDFTKERPEEIPQVVVISLGTNDFSRDTNPPSTDPNILSGDNIPDGDLYNPAEVQRFFQTYLDFVRVVRQRRPGAHIFLATPPMITDQFPLDNARTTLRDVLMNIVVAMNDPLVYRMDLVEMGFRYGLGCDYHPNLEVHRIMTDQLVGAIRSKTCW